MKYQDPQKEYIWFVRQPDNIARYGGQVILLHHRVVLGSGADDMEALQDARRRAAADNRALPERDLVFIPVPQPAWYPPGYFFNDPPHPGTAEGQ